MLCEMIADKVRAIEQSFGEKIHPATKGKHFNNDLCECLNVG